MIDAYDLPTANIRFLAFGLLMEQNKQFEDVSGKHFT